MLFVTRPSAVKFFGVVLISTIGLGTSLVDCKTAHADEIVIPVGQQGKDKASLQTPDKGLTMEAVAQQFGDPLMKSPMIGSPAISHWEYEHYRVYFEEEYVIHTVLKPYTAESAATADEQADDQTTEQPAETTPGTNTEASSESTAPSAPSAE